MKVTYIQAYRRQYCTTQAFRAKISIEKSVIVLFRQTCLDLRRQLLSVLMQKLRLSSKLGKLCPKSFRLIQIYGGRNKAKNIIQKHEKV